MQKATQVSTCALPPQFAAWRSLVTRSTAAWDQILPGDDPRKHLPKQLLEQSHTLEDFLPDTACPGPMLWFFQARKSFLSQGRTMKWSSSNLGGHVLLPASGGFVKRSNSFFVSHFWRSKENPDPDGEYLRRYQAELASQSWEYILVDWTCAPQSPRSEAEQAYFYRCLWTMSGIIGTVASYTSTHPLKLGCGYCTRLRSLV